MPANLQDILGRSAARHDHLCPRQVLGARMGMAGLAALDLEPPITKRSGLVLVETDGCFVDGIEAATGATVGHRTLRVSDYGKIAATFVSVATGRALRLSPRPHARERASLYARHAPTRYSAQLEGYQVMPERELFDFQWVTLTPPLEVVLSRPDIRLNCDVCGEEVFNEREVLVGASVLCRSCAAGGYYVPETNRVQMPTLDNVQSR